MSLVASHHPSTNNSSHQTTNILDDRKPSSPEHSEATLSTLLGAYTHAVSHPSMDRSAAEYSQSGLQSSYPHALTNAQSEDSTAEHHSTTAQYPQQQQHQQPEVRSKKFSASATPTSEYAVYPTSARSTGSFPDHIHRQYHPASNHSGSSGGMAQSTSPSLPLQDGSNHQNPNIKSDSDVQLDPSIAASSPTYPPQDGQYSPYPPQHQMQHGYPSHAGGAMYTQPRPDWAGYAGQQHHPMAAGGYPSVSGAQTPTSVAPAGARPGQVYSFVPIPGAQQHKRPRRRYEEIERMYKCGWNGCEKAYGTLNHLNAHVTMQSHGQKRTPEEFKEIRKEWKARKKEEDNQRKADEERARAGAVAAQATAGGDGEHGAGYQPQGRPVQLPPIGYQPGSQVQGSYPGQAPSGGVQQLQDYNNVQHYSGYPASPYGAPGQMYSQHSQPAPQPKYEH